MKGLNLFNSQLKDFHKKPKLSKPYQHGYFISLLSTDKTLSLSCNDISHLYILCIVKSFINFALSQIFSLNIWHSSYSSYLVDIINSAGHQLNVSNAIIIRNAINC